VAEFYRYERAQKGRQRSFFQLNADIFGEPGPRRKSELIALLIQTFSHRAHEQDFFVRLSDRNSGFLSRGAGIRRCAHARVAAAVDRYEKMGDDAFRAKVGGVRCRWTRKAKRDRPVHCGSRASRRWSRKSRAPAGPAHRAARRLEETLTALDAMGSVTLCRSISARAGLATKRVSCSKRSIARATCAARCGGRYDTLVEKLGGPAMRRSVRGGATSRRLLLEQRGLDANFVQAPTFTA